MLADLSFLRQFQAKLYGSFVCFLISVLRLRGWSLITCEGGGGGAAILLEVIFKMLIVLKGSFSDKGSVT